MAKLDDLSQFIADTYQQMRTDGDITLSTEKIAYTSQFELLYEAVLDQFPDLDEQAQWSGRNEVFMRLRNTSKQGRKVVRMAEKKDDKLSLQQIRILKVLVQSTMGLTRMAIAQKADVALSMHTTLGPVYQEDVAQIESESGKKTLMGRGLVRSIKLPDPDTGRDNVLYQLTPLGEREVRRLVNSGRPVGATTSTGSPKPRVQK